MSFDIQWGTICNDPVLATHLRDFLNSKLATVDLPHYLANMQVVGFRFGKTAPDITIRDISVPFDEFYEALGEDAEDADADADDEDEEGKAEGENEFEKNKEHQRQEQGPPQHGPQPNIPLRAQTPRQALPNDDFKIPPSPTPLSLPLDSLKNVHSIPMTPGRIGSPFDGRSPSPSPHPFINSTNAFLMPRNNSGIAPISQFGVGIANFGMAGSSGTPGVINQNNNNNNNSQNKNNKLIDYGGSSSSHLESESDYFQHNDSYNNYNSQAKNNKYFDEDVQDTEDTEQDKGMDVQLSVDIDWDSEMYIEITCDLLVNYPAREFIRLPLRLKITDVKVHSLMIIAYISKRVFISFLCDIENDEDDGDGEEELASHEMIAGLHIESRQDSKATVQGSITASTPYLRERKKGKDRIDIIQDMNIEGEIGSLGDGNTDVWQAHEQMMMDADGNGFLRNIGKIENFLMGTLRSLLINELGWPGWIELDFNESEDDGGDDETDGNEDGDDCEASEDGVGAVDVACSTTEYIVDPNQENALVSDADLEAEGELDHRYRQRTSRRNSRRRESCSQSRKSYTIAGSRRMSKNSKRPDSYGDSESVYSHESYFTSGDDEY